MGTCKHGAHVGLDDVTVRRRRVQRVSSVRCLVEDDEGGEGVGLHVEEREQVGVLVSVDRGAHLRVRVLGLGLGLEG